MKNIKSPLSLNNNVSLVRTIQTKDIISLYKEYQIDVSHYFNGLLEISEYQCNETNYRFYFPYNVAGNSLFYEHFQNFEWYYMPWKWEHEITTRYILDGMKVLEVGCAHGAFLERINQKFKLLISIGLEINESTTKKNEKWQIINQNIQDYSKEHRDEFDIVCSYQVLEHISDVHSFITSNIVCLKKGGKLIISVPNNDSFIKESNTPLNMPPHHMGRWTKESLTSLTKIFSLELLDIHIEGLKDYHVDGYIWSERYNKGNKYFNKVRRKIDIFMGSYAKFKEDVIKKRETITGHTILAVYRKV
jgi:2-polyprenyl-3-methyl-5-hydroxy-6-metoxy-1,4-benzoquinol methylase